MIRLVLTLVACLASGSALAGGFGPSYPDGLELKTIMGHPSWRGAQPGTPWWSQDGSSIFFERSRADSSERDRFRIELSSSKEELLEGAQRGSVDPRNGQRNRADTLRIEERDGDLFLLDRRRCHT